MDSRDVDVSHVVDLHVHSAPDLIPRSGDDLDLARDATEAGVRGMVLKSHHTLTSPRAYLCEKVLSGPTRVLGGIALNPAVGGLNPAAVETALKLGARVVWMPTVGARHHRRNREQRDEGIWLFGEAGKLLPGVVEIVDLVSAADALLCTGHISPEESLALIRLARERGLSRVLVTHPDIFFVGMSVEQQIEAARLGAVLERAFVATIDAHGLHGNRVPLSRIAEVIRAVGVESNVLSSDLGQADTPRPVEGMRQFLAGLAEHGFTPAELQRMSGTNPWNLLGLSS